MTKTVGQLSAASSITIASDVVPIEQSSVLRKVTVEDLVLAVSNIATPSGTMTMYGGSFAPTGWLLCDGSEVSRATYADLYAAIGTTWGSGNGSTTFNVPDMREVAPVGIGTTTSTITAHDVYTLGELKDDQMQGHYHVVAVTGNNASDTASYMTHGSTQNNTYSGTGNDGVKAPKTDGTNGTPRTGTVTRGKRRGVNFIIKT